MKSITIHNLDDALEALIEARARAEGLSLNKTVKMLLGKALGVEPGGHVAQKADFAEFCGGWSRAEAKEFENKTKDLRKVDSRDWQ